MGLARETELTAALLLSSLCSIRAVFAQRCHKACQVAPVKVAETPAGLLTQASRGVRKGITISASADMRLTFSFSSFSEACSCQRGLHREVLAIVKQSFRNSNVHLRVWAAFKQDKWQEVVVKVTK